MNISKSLLFPPILFQSCKSAEPGCDHKLEEWQSMVGTAGLCGKNEQNPHIRSSPSLTHFYSLHPSISRVALVPPNSLTIPLAGDQNTALSTQALSHSVGCQRTIGSTIKVSQSLDMLQLQTWRGFQQNLVWGDVCVCTVMHLSLTVNLGAQHTTVT